MYIYLTGNYIWMRYAPSQATLLGPLLCWVRYVPPRTASRRQLAAAAPVGPRLAATAFVGSPGYLHAHGKFNLQSYACEALISQAKKEDA